MENRQHITEELRQTSPFLAGKEPVNPYTIPQGYFGMLPAIIMEKIRIEEVLKPGSANIYQVPAGYFEELPAAILTRVQQSTDTADERRAELEAIAPLLNTISKEEIYFVPDGYFTRIDFVAATRNEKIEGKVVSLKIARKWMQYATAAVIAGILVTSAFLFTDNNRYVEYEKYSRIDVSSELNKVSEEELVTYLDNQENFVIAHAISAPVSEEVTDENEPIEVLNDEELSEYLKEYAEPSARGTAEAQK